MALARRGSAALRAVQGRPTGSSGPAPTPAPAAHEPDLAELVYELLDAHADTAELIEELDLDERWFAHLQYLQALQRYGRGRLARICADEAA